MGEGEGEREGEGGEGKSTYMLRCVAMCCCVVVCDGCMCKKHVKRKSATIDACMRFVYEKGGWGEEVVWKRCVYVYRTFV